MYVGVTRIERKCAFKTDVTHTLYEYCVLKGRHHV